MFQDSPMTVAEAQVTETWNEYADAALRARDAWSDPFMTSAERCELHGAAVSAHDRFADAYRLLNEPTPPSAEHERNRLACECVLLISAIAAFVGLFLPDLEATFWPLALTFAAVGMLGAWSHRFTGRLADHIGRRL